MTDEYLIKHGYKKHSPALLDLPNVLARFQKFFTDNDGKKYFINVIKWENEPITPSNQDNFWEPISYYYEVHLTMFEKAKSINLNFFSDWTLEEVEEFMEKMFNSMQPNYYELFNEQKYTRP